jgi:transposase
MSVRALARAEQPDTAFSQAMATAEALRAEGRLEDALEFMAEALRAVLKSNQELALLLAKLQRGRHSSERIDPGQLALLLQELAASGQAPVGSPIDPDAEAREDAEIEQEILKAKAEEKEKQAAGELETAPARKRQQWSAPGLAPVKHPESRVEPSKRRCRGCEGELTRIGADVTKQLVFVPGRFELHEYPRETLACPRCRSGKVMETAPPPEAGPVPMIPGSTVSASVLAQVVVSKFGDHLPLTRQHTIYAREGVMIPVSTMADWVGTVGELLEPIAKGLEERVLGAYLVQTDSTGLPVLDPSAAANIVRGTMWAYVGDDAKGLGQDVIFRYTPTGEAAEGPWSVLAGRRGYVQADAAGAFDRLFNGKVASAIEVGCLAHFRRKFVELQDVDNRVLYPIKLLTRLYRVERLADARRLSADGRRALRAERDPPILEKLKSYCLAIASNPKEPPSSRLAQAVRYGLNHWAALTRFVEDGRLPLDNNRCEQQLRGIALTRKNALFAGSHEAATGMATIVSVLRTCALRNVPPLAYLTDALPKLARGNYTGRIEELLPERWAATSGGDIVAG